MDLTRQLVPIPIFLLFLRVLAYVMEQIMVNRVIAWDVIIIWAIIAFNSGVSFARPQLTELKSKERAECSFDDRNVSDCLQMFLPRDKVDAALGTLATLDVASEDKVVNLLVHTDKTNNCVTVFLRKEVQFTLNTDSGRIVHFIRTDEFDQEMNLFGTPMIWTTLRSANEFYKLEGLQNVYVFRMYSEKSDSRTVLRPMLVIDDMVLAIHMSDSYKVDAVTKLSEFNTPESAALFSYDYSFSDAILSESELISKRNAVSRAASFLSKKYIKYENVFTPYLTTNSGDNFFERYPYEEFEKIKTALTHSMDVIEGDKDKNVHLLWNVVFDIDIPASSSGAYLKVGLDAFTGEIISGLLSLHDYSRLLGNQEPLTEYTELEPDREPQRE